MIIKFYFKKSVFSKIFIFREHHDGEPWVRDFSLSLSRPHSLALSVYQYKQKTDQTLNRSVAEHKMKQDQNYQ